jgi:hypothetical protein
MGYIKPSGKAGGLVSKSVIASSPSGVGGLAHVYWLPEI